MRSIGSSSVGSHRTFLCSCTQTHTHTAIERGGQSTAIFFVLFSCYRKIRPMDAVCVSSDCDGFSPWYTVSLGVVLRSMKTQEPRPANDHGGCCVVETNQTVDPSWWLSLFASRVSQSLRSGGVGGLGFRASTGFGGYLSHRRRSSIHQPRSNVFSPRSFFTGRVTRDAFSLCQMQPKGEPNPPRFRSVVLRFDRLTPRQLILPLQAWGTHLIVGDFG